MYYTASGQPSENGPYEIVDGNLRPRALKDGERVNFDLAFMDSSTGRRFFTDAKAAEPASIDGAAQQALATDGAIMDAARNYADSYLSSIAAADANVAAFHASIASFDEGARIARKHLISNAWRR